MRSKVDSSTLRGNWRGRPPRHAELQPIAPGPRAIPRAEPRAPRRGCRWDSGARARPPRPGRRRNLRRSWPAEPVAKVAARHCWGACWPPGCGPPAPAECLLAEAVARRPGAPLVPPQGQPERAQPRLPARPCAPPRSSYSPSARGPGWASVAKHAPRKRRPTTNISPAAAAKTHRGRPPEADGGRRNLPGRGRCYRRSRPRQNACLHGRGQRKHHPTDSSKASTSGENRRRLFMILPAPDGVAAPSPPTPCAPCAIVNMP